MHSPQSIISKIQINIGLYVYIYLITVTCIIIVATKMHLKKYIKTYTITFTTLNKTLHKVAVLHSRRNVGSLRCYFSPCETDIMHKLFMLQYTK